MGIGKGVISEVAMQSAIVSARRGGVLRRILPQLFRIVVFGFALSAASAVNDAVAQSTPIRISHSGVDPVGQRVAYTAREQARASASWVLLSEVNRAVLSVSIVSMAGDPDRPELSTVMSVSYAYDSPSTPLRGTLITHYIHRCGANRTAQCGVDILVDADRAVTSLRRESEVLWRTLYARGSERTF